MKNYLEIMQKILDEGEKKDDRTGTGTLSCFGAQMHFNLLRWFSIANNKKTPLKINNL